MVVLTVDAKRRVTLPKDMPVKAGQQIGAEMQGDHLNLFPITVLPQGEFQKLMEAVGDQHAEAFHRLAK